MEPTALDIAHAFKHEDHRPAVHTVFSSGCSTFFDWQSAALEYSHRRAQQLGPLTRLISQCDDEHSRTHALRTPGVLTHEHPNYALPAVNGAEDAYAPYNKPGGIAHWLATRSDITANFILILEADMLFRDRIDCEALGARPGRAVAGRYDNLKGVSNGMARGFVKNAHLVQAVGGSWACIHRDDLKRMAPQWLEMTKQVRKNPQRYWHMPTVDGSVAEDLETGDVYAKRGHAPFIAGASGGANGNWDGSGGVHTISGSRNQLRVITACWL